jgi:hypothetical protein
VEYTCQLNPSNDANPASVPNHFVCDCMAMQRMVLNGKGELSELKFWSIGWPKQKKLPNKKIESFINC